MPWPELFTVFLYCGGCQDISKAVSALRPDFDSAVKAFKQTHETAK
jgi:hypothetical protein